MKLVAGCYMESALLDASAKNLDKQRMKQEQLFDGLPSKVLLNFLLHTIAVILSHFLH